MKDVKKYFQNLRVEASRERREEKAKNEITDRQIIETIYNSRHELKLTSHGNIDSTIIQFIVNRELGVSLGKTKARDLSKRYKLNYPEDDIFA